MSGLPCPNCGSELSYLEQYHRHYCYGCGRYAPEGYGDRGGNKCPTCGGILSYIAQYDRYYCYRCNAYPVDVAMEPKETGVDTTYADATSPSSQAAATVVLAKPAKPEQPKVTAVEVTTEPEPPEEEPVEEEIPEEGADAVTKPTLDRAEILEAKKPVLMDLCKAYDLEPTGTKEQLRERLLSYLDEIEAESRPEETEEPPAEPSRQVDASEPTSAETNAPEEVPKEEPVPAVALPQSVAPVGAAPATQLVQEPLPTYLAAEQPHSVAFVQETPLIRDVHPVEHPCPTCGHELTYISQYDRWYCYHCHAYAPLAKSKNACPSCGASLRWIDQYERWWCDSCRRYAPADLPKPERTAVASSSVVVERVTEPVALQPVAIVVHRHRSPGSAIGLVGFGLALFVIYELFVDLPAVLTFSSGVTLSPDIAFGLRFFAFLFVAAGAMMGLYAVRDRR